jgi:hypothetical protein
MIEIDFLPLCTDQRKCLFQVCNKIKPKQKQHIQHKQILKKGNALAVQADKPFRALSTFGNDFLNRLIILSVGFTFIVFSSVLFSYHSFRFQGSFLTSNILEDISFIDTPGKLSKQKKKKHKQFNTLKRKN